MSLQKKKCIICNSGNTTIEKITNIKNIECEFAVCNDCDFIHNPKNYFEYKKDSFKTVSSDPKTSKRAGDGKRAGREYKMAETTLNILKDNSPKNILLFGVGMSLDHKLLKKNFPENKVYISDIDNFQQEENFVHLDKNKKFDIIIASEVIEHFTDPINEFKRIFSKLNEEGMIVASTNIKDNTPLSRLLYPFLRGHTSYYSGKSLIHLARKFGFEIDFRLPAISQNKTIGPRKRYVFFYKSPKVHDAILVYFSQRCFALSEDLRD